MSTVKSTQAFLSPFAILTVFIVAFGGMLYGYDVGIMNQTLPLIAHIFHLNSIEQSMLVGAVLLSAGVGIFCTGILADRFGRKKLLFCGGLIFLVGVGLIVTAHDYWTLLLGRLFQGLAVGISALVVPLYLSETMPPQTRGRGIALFQAILMGGIFFSAVVGYVLIVHFNIHWRDAFASEFIFSALFTLGILLIPESPLWLGMYRSRQKQKTILPIEPQKGLRHKYATSQINTKWRYWRKQWLRLGKPSNRKPLLFVLLLVFLQQLTGVTPIFQYSVTILHDFGGKTAAFVPIGSISIACIGFLATILGMLFIDKVGRRFITIVGTAGITLSLLFIAAVYFCCPVSALKNGLLLAGLMTFVCFFSFGPGLIIWIAAAELLPNRIRSIGMSIALGLKTLTSALLSSVYLPLIHQLGYGGLFLVLALFAATYFYIANFKLPETKGLALDDIEKQMSGKPLVVRARRARLVQNDG